MNKYLSTPRAHTNSVSYLYLVGGARVALPLARISFLLPRATTENRSDQAKLILHGNAPTQR